MLPSGTLCIIRPLDREVDDTDSITVLIRDLGSPSLRSNKSFTIFILDRNDNVPRLLTVLDYYIYVDEDTAIGVPVQIVDVIDFDLGINRELVFTLENYFVPGREHFILTPSEFLPSPNEDIQRSQLLVNANLDFEQVLYYIIMVTVFNPTLFEPSSLQPLQVSLIRYFII